MISGSEQCAVDSERVNDEYRDRGSVNGHAIEKSALPLAVILLGPTGSGKTALSLALGERFGGEIVSCDSVAVYRGMELGTAKPTIEERARVPHHLIDVTTPDWPFTAGEYSRLAREALQEIAARERLPIVTGGTGLYLRALTEGLFAGPERQEDLRARLRRSAERHGSGWLQQLLARLDRGDGRAHSRQRHAQADSRDRGVRGGAEADVGGDGARSAHGVPAASDRAESAASSSFTTAEPALRGDVCGGTGGGDAGVAGAVWTGEGAGLAGLSTGTARAGRDR